MADLTITGTSVVPVDGTTGHYLAGETITAGQPLYLSASNTLMVADANDTAVKAAVVGISLNGGSAGQPIKYQSGGTINLGATLAVGVIYVVSATVGKICPVTDMAAASYCTILGVATTAANLKLCIFASGVQQAA